MTTTDPAEPPGAREQLDPVDFEILSAMRELWETADPMPDTLVERVRFAVGLESIGVEVMRVRELEELAGARGDERTRLITFDSESLTIMVNVRLNKNDTIRLDGWLTPPASHQIELRTAGGPMTTLSDDGGRFVIDEVPHGLTQLVVRPSSPPTTVSTPTLSL